MTTTTQKRAAAVRRQEWDNYRRAFLGRIPTDPQPGHYLTRLERKGPFVPVRIWLDREDIPRIQIGHAQEGLDALQAWPWCAGYPIAEAEWRCLMSNIAITDNANFEPFLSTDNQEDDMGYRMSEAFPSKYLSAPDLGGRRAKAVIDRFEMEQIVPGEPAKLVMYFKGKEKGLVLNKTNATACATVWGDDTDGWEGGPVEIYAVETSYQGKPTQGVRIKPIASPVQAARPRHQAPAHPDAPSEQFSSQHDPRGGHNTGAELDDEIPF